MLGVLIELAFQRRELQFLISAGPQAKEAKWHNVPANVRLVSFAPVSEILPGAVALISQAGANLIKEAIWCNTPMVLVPDRADQPGNAARVVYRGLGVCLRGGPPTAKQLSDMLDNVTTSTTIARNLKTMSDQFRLESELLDVAIDALDF